MTSLGSAVVKQRRVRAAANVAADAHATPALLSATLLGVRGGALPPMRYLRRCVSVRVPHRLRSLAA